MAKLKNLMDCARNRLAESSGLALDEAKIDVRALLRHALENVSHAWLIAHEHDEVTPEIRERFEALLARRIKGEPIAYIIGSREFYGLELTVTPDTLIPRPDTETLVEAALEKIPKSGNLKILDLGTGSGAIALAIAKHRPESFLTAVDQSTGALKIAAQNAQRLNINNIEFITSNWYANLADQKFDLIVSNPPYIEVDDHHLQQGDLRFEPISALASGTDGLDDIRIIAKQAVNHLKNNGWLMLEHGYNQATNVASILHDRSFISIDHRQDLSGIERITIGQLANTRENKND